ncbi:hypothetical protein COO59_02650 [Mixta theicola]|uniref:Uncharacterized protein n=1 Tax=Mixta theicola TaxID=1458355 RepID=A0A2K1QCT4_9GAMM|nr:hypothetical protein [Mixta theicola]PNS12838.1 hypothetical protein COO59_02650 [Mixta theicola]GLR09087.1 hypothetical protein GCM10007905_18070 [Mixta theicola]
MLFEETKLTLLAAGGTAENLLSQINNLYVKEIHSEEKALIKAISELHNLRKIDFVKIMSNIDKKTCRSNFFTILRVFVEVLPSLNAKTEDVLNCLAHLKQQADGDLSFFEVHGAFERFCSMEAHRPKAGVEYILTQSELNLYAPFLSNSILAYDTDNVADAIKITKTLIANSNEAVRTQAYFILGKLGFDESQDVQIWEILRESILSEHDSGCCASILRAILLFGEKAPSRWIEIEDLIIKLDEKNSPEVLYEISKLISFQNLDLPESVLNVLVKQLAKVSPEHVGIINNIDHLLVRLINRGLHPLTEELLESIISVGVNFKTLDYFSRILLTKHQKFSNHIITKWFLDGNAMLCRNVLNLIESAADEGVNLKAEEFLLDNEEKKIFVSRKAVGWLFTQPTATANFILSVSKTASTTTILELENILYDPLLISYPGELKPFFQSCIETKFQKNLCQRLLEKLEKHHMDLEKISGLNELKSPSENLTAYWKEFSKSMQNAHEEASKKSFISKIAATQRILYGNSSIYYQHQLDGKKVRQEAQMHTFSNSTEMPRLNTLDPVSLEYFLISCRCEAMNNEINP